MRRSPWWPKTFLSLTTTKVDGRKPAACNLVGTSSKSPLPTTTTLSPASLAASPRGKERATTGAMNLHLVGTFQYTAGLQMCAIEECTQHKIDTRISRVNTVGHL